MLTIFIISTIWCFLSLVEYHNTNQSKFLPFSTISLISAYEYFTNQPWLWLVLLSLYGTTLIYMILNSPKSENKPNEDN